MKVDDRGKKMIVGTGHVSRDGNVGHKNGEKRKPAQAKGS